MRALLFCLLLPILGCGNVAWFLGGYAVGLNSVPPEINLNVEVDDVHDSGGISSGTDDETGTDSPGPPEDRPPGGVPPDNRPPAHDADEPPPGRDNANHGNEDPGDLDPDNGDDDDPDGLLDLCHHLQCPEAPQARDILTIQVDQSAAEAHLRHGDTLGACP